MVERRLRQVHPLRPMAHRAHRRGRARLRYQPQLSGQSDLPRHETQPDADLRRDLSARSARQREEKGKGPGGGRTKTCSTSSKASPSACSSSMRMQATLRRRCSMPTYGASAKRDRTAANIGWLAANDVEDYLPMGGACAPQPPAPLFFRSARRDVERRISGGYGAHRHLPHQFRSGSSRRATSWRFNGRRKTCGMSRRTSFHAMPRMPETLFALGKDSSDWKVADAQRDIRDHPEGRPAHRAYPVSAFRCAFHLLHRTGRRLHLPPASERHAPYAGRAEYRIVCWSSRGGYWVKRMGCCFHLKKFFGL